MDSEMTGTTVTRRDNRCWWAVSAIRCLTDEICSDHENYRDRGSIIHGIFGSLRIYRDMGKLKTELEETLKVTSSVSHLIRLSVL